MRDYWLAKLIGSVEKIDSRKRLQKTIYLLGFKGEFPLHFDYFLHFYGPYSRDLATLVDQLDYTQLLSEKPVGSAYQSELTDRGKKLLAQFESTSDGLKAKDAIEPFIGDFESLCSKSVWVLELASTIAYYYQADGNEENARKRTAEFKKVALNDSNLTEALSLAKGFCVASG